MIVTKAELTNYMDIKLSLRQQDAADLILAGLQGELEAYLRRPIEQIEFEEEYRLPSNQHGVPMGTFLSTNTSDFTSDSFTTNPVDSMIYAEPPKMIINAESFYEKTGWWAVVAARFFPWIRTFVPPIAGASHMNYYKFLSANILGAILWGAGITLAGYYAASIPGVKTFSYAIAAFFITASVISGFVNYSRRPR